MVDFSKICNFCSADRQFSRRLEEKDRIYNSGKLGSHFPPMTKYVVPISHGLAIRFAYNLIKDIQTKCLFSQPCVLSALSNFGSRVVSVCFLAHLSRRLTGELIGYPWIRRPSVVVVRRSHFQTSSPPKPLGQSKPNFMWSLLGKGERKFI